MSQFFCLRRIKMWQVSVQLHRQPFEAFDFERAERFYRLAGWRWKELNREEFRGMFPSEKQLRWQANRLLLDVTGCRPRACSSCGGLVAYGDGTVALEGRNYDKDP